MDARYPAMDPGFCPAGEGPLAVSPRPASLIALALQPLVLLACNTLSLSFCFPFFFILVLPSFSIYASHGLACHLFRACRLAHLLRRTHRNATILVRHSPHGGTEPTPLRSPSFSSPSSSHADGTSAAPSGQLPPYTLPASCFLLPSTHAYGTAMIMLETILSGGDLACKPYLKSLGRKRSAHRGVVREGAVAVEGYRQAGPSMAGQKKDGTAASGDEDKAELGNGAGRRGTIKRGKGGRLQKGWAKVRRQGRKVGNRVGPGYAGNGDPVVDYDNT